MEEPKRGSPSRACATMITEEAAGPGSSANETGGAAEGEFSTELPEDLIYTILSKLPPCRTEHWAFSRLNQRWNSAVRSLFENQPPQVPSLILPSSCAPLFHSTVSCQWHEEHSMPSDNCLWKNLYLPDNVRVHGKMCGSSEGGWFVLVLEHDDPKEHKHYLFNINKRKMVYLPDTVKSADEIRSFVLEAAVLSSSPLVPDYTVAAIGKEPTNPLVIKKFDMDHWENVPCPIETDDSLVDLIYHKSQFWFLTAKERLGKLVEEQDWKGNRSMYWLEVTTRQRKSYIQDTVAAEKMNLTIKRYLVESKGELYMVVTLLSPNGSVIELKVFRLHLNEAEDEDNDVDEEDASSDTQMLYDHLFFTWEDASDELPDRVLFIGQASSRSFETNSTPRIYFLDDACTEDPAKPGYFIREEMGFIAIAEDMAYDMHEIYPVLGPPSHPDRASNRVPPCWWIH